MAKPIKSREQLVVVQRVVGSAHLFVAAVSMHHMPMLSQSDANQGRALVDTLVAAIEAEGDVALVSTVTLDELSKYAKS
jgi:hypothetical protein